MIKSQCGQCMKQIYMKSNFKKTKQSLQLELVPAIQHNTSKYSNQLEHISGKSVATGVTVTEVQ